MFYDMFEVLCRERKMSPSGVSIALGMSKTSPGKWKTGSLPDLNTVLKIADYFGVTVDYLVRGNVQERIIHNAQMAGNGAANVQDASWNNITVTSGGSSANGAEPADKDFEGELLSVYRSLTVLDKLDVLQYAFGKKAKEESQKEQQKGPDK